MIGVVALAALAPPALAANGTILASLGSAGSNYSTTNVTISRGGGLSFQNFDLAPHNVTATKLKKHRPVFRSKDITFGGSASVTGVSALKRGTYGYFCSIHPRMKGTLHVR
jgi:plastocyanin